MIKKKDPYIVLLDFYYNRFPDAITLKEVYTFFHEKKYISAEELEIMKAFGSERKQKDPQVEKEANRKRMIFEKMFIRAGDPLNSVAGRNSPRIMNSEHYFHRLEYIELVESRKSSRLAFTTSILAILISLSSLYLAWESSQKPVEILSSQIKEITTSIKELSPNVELE